jgi:hypothetical protein
MSRSKRRIGVPLILLWALAHGMWIGAGLHAGSQLNFEVPAVAPLASHSCACAWTPHTKQSSQLSSINPTVAQSCAVCALGIVVPEVPVVTVIIAVPPLPAPRTVAFTPIENSTESQFLPPSRAPPIA